MSSLDHEKHAADREAFERRMEELGPAAVRALFQSGGFPTSHNVVILEWLKKKELSRTDG